MADFKLKEVKSAQRRESVRINVPRLDMRVWTHQEDKSVVQDAKLMNLSASGALLQTTQAFAPGARVQSTFSLTAGGNFSLNCQVVRCMVSEKMSDRFLVAVTFRAPRATEEALVRWIFRYMAHQHRLAR